MDPLTRLVLSTAGPKKSPPYVDDVFSTYLYKGTGSAKTITNNIDLSGKGGMVWIKTRDAAYDHNLFDTARGAGYYLQSNADSQQTQDLQKISAFNANGFSLGNEATVNQNNKDVASWTFRKQEGFFDIVTWTGNSTAGRQIPHELGSIPGCIMVKRTNSTGNWIVYHKDISNGKALWFNSTAAQDDSVEYWNDTTPTKDNFTLGIHPTVNQTGGEYVAYIFAGGESTVATARSVEFNGSSDSLEIADDPDFAISTNWTAECWFKAESLPGSYNGIFGKWSGTGGDSWVIEYVGTELRFYVNGVAGHKVLGSPTLGQWHHVAVSKEGSITRCFLNGVQTVPDFDMGTPSGNSKVTIGGQVASAGWFNGRISNARIVKGTAVYTRGFTPSTKPLENITNTVLLCCNDSSQTGSTVTPGTITNNGAGASTQNPFDDPEGFKFGEDEDQNIIKCGAYYGNGSASTNFVILPWEPQWFFIKRIDGTNGWSMFDSIRKLSNDNTDARFYANANDAETLSSYMELQSTGFQPNSDNADWNTLNGMYVYMAIRRPDGLAGKPAEAGTDAFAMDTGVGSATIPNFDSPFPVDWAATKYIAASADNWVTSVRMNAASSGEFNTASQWPAPDNNTNKVFDSNVGWGAHSGWDNNYESWMWKRGQGLDVVCYKGTGLANRDIRHSLGRTPEMMWIKNRSGGSSWQCWHKGLNAGTNTTDYRIILDSDNAETGTVGAALWSSTLPNADVFTLGPDGAVNGSANNIIAFLFASVTGISKVGYYAGGTADQIISLGFTPRFIIIKPSSTQGTWSTYDTLRGWTGSGGSRLRLDTNDEPANDTLCYPTATGFQVTTTSIATNASGQNYIYYAHA